MTVCMLVSVGLSILIGFTLIYMTLKMKKTTQCSWSHYQRFGVIYLQDPVAYQKKSMRNLVVFSLYFLSNHEKFNIILFLVLFCEHWDSLRKWIARFNPLLLLKVNCWGPRIQKVYSLKCNSLSFRKTRNMMLFFFGQYYDIIWIFVLQYFVFADSNEQIWVIIYLYTLK